MTRERGIGICLILLLVPRRTRVLYMTKNLISNVGLVKRRYPEEKDQNRDKVFLFSFPFDGLSVPAFIACQRSASLV